MVSVHVIYVPSLGSYNWGPGSFIEPASTNIQDIRSSGSFPAAAITSACSRSLPSTFVPGGGVGALGRFKRWGAMDFEVSAEEWAPPSGDTKQTNPSSDN